MSHHKKDITRMGCDARVQFSISKEGVWTVQKVVLEHNQDNNSTFCMGAKKDPRQ